MRQLLKLVAATGAAGIGALAGTPRRAAATYTPGSPSDTVDTNLTVYGNLVVNGNVGVGTSTSQGKLDVAGEIRGNDLVLIGSDGQGKQSYHAAGPAYEQGAPTSQGTWGRVRTASWQTAGTMSWSALETMNGTWSRVSDYTWVQLGPEGLNKSWYEVSAL